MSWTHPALEAVARLVTARTGLSFPPYRQDEGERGMCQAMRRAGLADPDRYPNLIATSAAALDDLVGELTIGETYFFREPAQFEFIRREVLPEIRQRRGTEHGIRAWSAGCASGEEAYSLAILLEQEGVGDRAHLLATDISRIALVRAQQAEYGPWSLRGEGAELARPYLTRRADRYAVEARLRRRVTFNYLNLVLDVYPSWTTGAWGMDLILCRNVFIYLEPAAVQQVAGRLFDSLEPGGWLITASSDPPLGTDGAWETVVTDVGVFYRRGRAVQDDTADAEARNLDRWPGAAPVGRICNPSGPHGRIENPSYDRDALAPARVDDVLVEALIALERGNYPLAVKLTEDRVDEPGVAVLHLRALAHLDLAAAERAGAASVERHPLSPELYYYHGLLLMDLGRDEEAARALRRVIYLDRSLAAAHFTLGALLGRRGDREGARRAYRNARDLCASCPADAVVPLTDGEPAERLAEAAVVQLALLSPGQEVLP